MLVFKLSWEKKDDLDKVLGEVALPKPKRLLSDLGCVVPETGLLATGFDPGMATGRMNTKVMKNSNVQ